MKRPFSKNSPESEVAGPAVQDRLRDALRAATLGEFEVYDELGRGGMARVYLCYDIALDRHVAVKVMAPALFLEEGMDERFRREARIAAGLSHPHIVPVYSVKQTEELAYFVMKYIDGCTLSFLLNEHAPLPAEMVRQLLQQVAGALTYAHDRGVVHRDVKPANILIDEAGRAILTDFGIARAVGLSGLTASGASVGTPYYMSPEQCSRGEITGHSDQYALGVVGYQMLSGRLPFTGADAGEVLQAHLLETPPELSIACPGCPPDLARVIMRMLAKRPAERWPTLAEASAELQRSPSGAESQIGTQIIALARTGPVRPPMPRPPVSPAPNSRRDLVAAGIPGAEARARTRRKVLGLAGGMAVLLVGGGALWRGVGVSLQQAGRTRTELSPNSLSGPPVVLDAKLDSTPEDSPKQPAFGSGSAPRNSALPDRKVSGPPPRRVGPDVAVNKGTPGDVASSSGAKPKDSPPVDPAPEGATSSKQWAWVLLGTRHPTGYVYINGGVRLPQHPSLRWWPVPAGKVTLSVQAEGCKPWEETRTLSGGDSVQIGHRSPDCSP